MKKILAAIFLIIVFTIIGLAFFRGCKKTNEAPNANQLQQEQLFSRSYTINPETFISNLKNLAGTEGSETDIQMLLRFFKQNGVEMKIGESIFLSEEKNKLFVRATEVHQNKIERVVEAIQNNIQPSQEH
ncbi:MAG TPA: hypothetical protein VGH42_01475 [Verrucomicrobiae bacterium]|jgi:hypothetical protein